MDPRSAGIWSQQGSKLVGTGAAGAAHQGTSVAVSADGNTVIEGGYNDSAGGAAWVWTRSGGVWSQQGAKLFGSGAVGGSQGFIYQGWSVSLSADGNTALVAGYSDDFRGATWVFTRSGGVWSQQGLKLVGVAASGDAVGFSVALSADASTAVMGGPGYGGGTGAVWFFVQTPQVTGVNPNSGTVDGGTSVTISGTGFTGTTNVTFGGTAATGVTVVDPDTITATTPAHAAGLVNVAVTNAIGTGTGTGAYTYSLGSTTTLGSSSNPSVFGQSVTFTATVTAGATGTVTFKEGPTTLGTDTLSGGTATFQTTTLALGGHTITAVYGGDSNFTGSTSSGLTQTVNQGATTTVVSPSANPSVFGQSVTFTATVSVTSPAAGTLTGSVTFKDGASTLGTGTLSGGVATFSTSSLAIGDHSITAVYGGDSNFAGSTSSILTQTVNTVPVMVVTPATNIASSGNQGGPFSPSSLQYQLSASNSSGVNYSISGLPAWLNVSPSSGTLTTSPTTVTFTVNGTANGLSGGSYPAIISFTNTTNGQGNQTRSALLTVNSGGGPAKTYVSARTGTDAGVCPLSAPCASLNYALSVTDNGGQVTILDAGVFGPIVIAQPVTIEGPKAYSAQIFADPTAQVGCIGTNPPGCGLANNGFAVEIAAGVNDTVKISNVLMGAGLSGGAGALKFTSGGKLQLSGNVYRGNDTATGPIVALYPNNPGTTQAQVYFSFSDIGFNGDNPNAGAVEVKPSGNTSLKLHFNHVEVHNASYGIRTDGSLLSSPSVNVAAEISQSEFFSFAFAAVNAFSTAGTGATNAAFDGVRVLNANVAIKANGPQSVVILTNSTVSGNGIGVQVQNSGSVYTGQDNTIYGNGTDVSGVLSSTPPK